MIENGVYCDFVTVDYIQHASRGGFHHQLSKTQRHTGIFLDGFNINATGEVGNAEHPHGNHGGEVKGRYACYANSWRMLKTSMRPSTLGVLALAQMRYTAGKLNDIQAALNVAVGVRYYFAMFFSDQDGQLIGVGFNQCFEVEQYALGVGSCCSTRLMHSQHLHAVDLGCGGQGD